MVLNKEVIKKKFISLSIKFWNKNVLVQNEEVKERTNKYIDNIIDDLCDLSKKEIDGFSERQITALRAIFKIYPEEEINERLKKARITRSFLKLNCKLIIEKIITYGISLSRWEYHLNNTINEEDKLNISIYDLGLNAYICRILKTNKYYIVRDIISEDKIHLKEIPYIGEKNFNDIIDRIEKLGLSFNEVSTKDKIINRIKSHMPLLWKMNVEMQDDLTKRIIDEYFDRLSKELSDLKIKNAYLLTERETELLRYTLGLYKKPENQEKISNIEKGFGKFVIFNEKRLFEKIIKLNIPKTIRNSSMKENILTYEEKLSIKIENIGITRGRVYEFLKSNNILTVKDIISHGREYYASLKGTDSYNNFIKTINDLGLKLKNDNDIIKERFLKNIELKEYIEKQAGKVKEDIDKYINEIINDICDKEKHELELCNEKDIYILRKRLGVINDEIVTLESIGNEFGISRECVRQREEKVYRNYRKRILDVIKYSYLIHQVLTEQEKMNISIDELILPSRLITVLKNNNCYTVKQIIEHRKGYFLSIIKIDKKYYNELVLRIHKLGLIFNGEENINETYIEDLNISTRLYNWLIKRHLITVKEICLLSKKTLKNLPSLGDKCYLELISKIHELGYSFADEICQENIDNPKIYKL